MIDDGLDIHDKDQPSNTNWEKPLIIAEPEIQVSILYYSLITTSSLSIHFFMIDYDNDPK
jgi:hypothetical protein